MIKNLEKFMNITLDFFPKVADACAFIVSSTIVVVFCLKLMKKSHVLLILLPWIGIAVSAVVAVLFIFILISLISMFVDKNSEALGLSGVSSFFLQMGVTVFFTLLLITQAVIVSRGMS